MTAFSIKKSISKVPYANLQRLGRQYTAYELTSITGQNAGNHSQVKKIFARKLLPFNWIINKRQKSKCLFGLHTISLQLHIPSSSNGKEIPASIEKNKTKILKRPHTHTPTILPSSVSHCVSQQTPQCCHGSHTLPLKSCHHPYR